MEYFYQWNQLVRSNVPVPDVLFREITSFLSETKMIHEFLVTVEKTLEDERLTLKMLALCDERLDVLKEHCMSHCISDVFRVERDILIKIVNHPERANVFKY